MGKVLVAYFSAPGAKVEEGQKFSGRAGEEELKNWAAKWL